MRLIADTHTHTLASNHAYSTVMENIVAAREQGLLYMAMTEHGPKMPNSSADRGENTLVSRSAEASARGRR